jgi:polyferredoxin
MPVERTPTLRYALWMMDMRQIGVGIVLACGLLSGGSTILAQDVANTAPPSAACAHCASENAGTTTGDEAAKGEICEFCGMVNCTMGCKAVTFDSQYRKMVVMPGLPNWLYYGGLVAVVLVSFFFAETIGRRTSRERKRWRFDLLRARGLKRFLRLPAFPVIFQLPTTLIFILLIYAGFAGHQVINIVPTLTWTLWWAGLIFIVLFAGKIWCVFCPWDFVASAISRLRFWGTGPAPLNLGLQWPRWMRSVWPALLLFIGLTWLELGCHVTKSPMKTAYVALGMIVLALIPAVLFDKKSFCRYGCFVGRIAGMYANFSPVEVRAASREVCASCKSRDCFAGNAKGNPCPTSLCLASLEDSTYCTMCGECVKSCPKDNVALNLRPFGEGLYSYAHPKLDEAFLSVTLLSLTSFHGLTMTPFWENVTQPEGTILGWVGGLTGVGHLGAFTIGMAVVLAAPVLLYFGFCKGVAALAARTESATQGVTTRDVFIQFSYALLPIALFYHLAHNGMHLFMEGQNVITYLSDPMGRGWDLFNTATRSFPPLLSTNTIWITQVLLVIVGHVYGISITHRTTQRLFGRGTTSYLVEVPLLAAMILFSFFSLWIMHLDMNMRGTLL